MKKHISLNAFDMNCVGHQSPGLWTHPRDRADSYNTLEYWTDLAKTLERGQFDVDVRRLLRAHARVFDEADAGLFIAVV